MKLLLRIGLAVVITAGILGGLAVLSVVIETCLGKL